MGKNIVVMCDGTWNGKRAETNVYTLFKELLEKECEQRVLYIDGIGIGRLTFGFIVDGAIALSLDNKIKEGYKFIVDHYNPGDDIWLFGFSRGAYTARCIAGMIKNCGILKLDQDQDIESDRINIRINLAYDIYRDRDLTNHPKGKGSENFKKAFSHPDSKEQIIKFLGLWDTVGAHGLPGLIIGEGFKYLEFYDQVVPRIVKNAYQALSIHERTVFFEPCRILPGRSRKTTVKETWFPGVHTEIGGGTFLTFKGNERITNATLLWMMENIVQVGGLLMRNDIEAYRNRFSPHTGPSWSIKNFIFDHINSFIPTIMLNDRSIPLELDSSNKVLRDDLLYKNGDWLLQFGTRSHLRDRYASNTYEKLRKNMETKEIKLYGDVRYDIGVNEECSLILHSIKRYYNLLNEFINSTLDALINYK